MKKSGGQGALAKGAKGTKVTVGSSSATRIGVSKHGTKSKK